MKRFFTGIRFILLMALPVMLWNCDESIDDVNPWTFQEPILHPDEIYHFNSNNDYILRLDPLANDTIKAEGTVTYTAPKNGNLFPEFDGPGTMGYKPLTDFYGTDSLTYTVCVGSSCKTEKIKLIVERPYDPATCTISLGQDYLETTKNTPKGIRIFLNDIICFNENYGGNYIEKPVKGTFATIDYSGSYKNTIYMYYPPKDYVGPDSFRYRVYTSRDASTYEEITVQVTVK